MGLLNYEQEMLFTKFENENSIDFINKNKIYHKAGISIDIAKAKPSADF